LTRGGPESQRFRNFPRGGFDRFGDDGFGGDRFGGGGLAAFAAADDDDNQCLEFSFWISLDR
jgi:hypothetical protein